MRDFEAGMFFQGWCEREGAARIGFGEVRGTLLAA
jgi:hypothetical protein